MNVDMSGSRKNDIAIYIAEHINRPFRWGENDCCTFVGEWIRIKTGRDYLTEHRPWRTARDANKKLRALSGLFSFLDLHFTRINPNMAQDGDLTIIDGTASVFSGRHVVSVGLNGLVYKDRSEAECAWRC
jgi:hypothetical protein